MSITNANANANESNALRLMSQEQLEAGKNIVDYFNLHTHRWAVLLAQMQSGKTETYLFIAAEMIRLKRVTNVVILSGNSETALKDQILRILEDNVGEDKSFYRKYASYLSTIGMAEDEIEEVLCDVVDATSVVWGTDLAKFVGPTINTLFIWEESHYAQNQGQLPSKMFKRVGISANGDVETLANKGNYVVSVSATGFSELSDNVHYNQGKWVELMKPGAGYNSVEKMLASGRIVSYTDMSDGMEQAMASAGDAPKYAVIRASITKEVSIIRQLKSRGWKVVHYDNNHTQDKKHKAIVIAKRIARGKDVWDNMDVAPKKKTAIILKGLCRMGQNVEKAHMSFFFETADNSNTDTALQSFIGRSCGYSKGSDKVSVYIPAKIFESGNLEKYVSLAKGKNVLPSKSRNIVNQMQRKPTASGAVYVDIVPICIRKEFLPSLTDSDFAKSAREALFDDVKNALAGGQFENFNSSMVLADVIALIDNPATELKRLQVKKHKTYKNVPALLKESVETRTHVSMGSGCYVKSDGTEVNVWVLETKDVYIDCIVLKRVDETEEELNMDNVPKTTGKEVFRYKLEDGTTEVSNGGFSLHLTPDSAFSVERMIAELSEIIDLSLKPTMLVGNTRSINSVKDSEYKGISLNASVLAGLQQGGSICVAIMEAFQVQLKITKMSGPQSKAHKAAGLTRIAKISW